MGQCPSCQKCSDEPCVTHSELIFWGIIAAFVLLALIVLLILLTHKITSKIGYKRGYIAGMKEQEQCQQQKNMEMQRQISGAANILAVAALRGAPLTTAASLTSNPQLLNAIADGGGGAEEFIGGGSGTTTTATIMDPRASFRFGGGGGPGSGGIIVGNGFQSRAGLMTGTNQQQQSEPMMPLNAMLPVPQQTHGKYLTTTGKCADSSSSTYIV